MAQTKATGQTKRRGSPKGPLIGILFLVGMFATPSAMLVLFGLVPSYAAWILDRDRNKLMAITVASLNIAALTPLLIKLWSGGHSLSLARSLLASPLSWIFILASAGIGWILAQAIPAIIVVVISSRNKLKLEKIRARQKQLVEEWGNSITEQGR